MTGQLAVMPPELLDARPASEPEQVLEPLSEPQESEPPEQQQQLTGKEEASTYKLRDRSTINRVDRYGIPVAFIADVDEVTYDEAMGLIADIQYISFEEAMQSSNAKEWREAVQEEIQALEANKTWILTTLPPGMRKLRTKWVFSIKTDLEKGSTKYKARLVAKGCSQREGIDYEETFAPVVRYDSIRALLAVAPVKNLEIMKFDVKTAFLYGDIDREIYLEQPEGFKNKEKPNLVFKLLRSLYGLKQAPRCWNRKFRKFLKKFNFKNVESDHCVSIGEVNGVLVYIVLYVDDGLVISVCLKIAIKIVLQYLRENFQITEGTPNEFIGMEIKRDRVKGELKVSQPYYIDKIIKKFGMSDANPVSTPVEPGTRLSKVSAHECLSYNHLPYREAVGSLLFLSRVCRPDIEYTVNYMSQFFNSYGKEHWNAVKYLIRYLIGTRDHGIVFGNSGSSIDIQGYSDSDYAGCIETRRSRSGFVFLLNEGPISWSSQRQSVVAVSTTEAEYVALHHCTKETIWLCQMMSALKFYEGCILSFADNQSAIKLAKNAEFHKRTKHIDISYHFTRHAVRRKQIEIKYVKSSENVADILTKPLNKKIFTYLKEKLNVN